MVSVTGFRSRAGLVRRLWIIGGRQEFRGDLPRLGGVEEVIALKA
jgi:hypothetical protein